MDSIIKTGKKLISVDKLSYSYGSLEVLVDISFCVLEGDFLAIIGANGSGKTTLLKIILGILPYEEGHVRLLEQDVNHFNQWNKIGYVPQKAISIDKLFPISVYEVVALGLLSSSKIMEVKTKSDKNKIETALESVNMLKYRKRRIGELSGGQQQRVFIARAIVNEPIILFLDEPTVGVDTQTQDKFYEMLDLLNKSKGITIVLITHDVAIVNKHVNKVACLNQRLVFHGSHEEFCNSSRLKDIFPGEHHLICHRH
ncbi:MAG: metal ABC transporter ATP-binding protein [bacterium]